MFDHIARIVWDFVWLLFSLYIAWWFLNTFIDVPKIVRALRKKKRVVRDPYGHRALEQKWKAPSLDDPHDPKELARIEREVDEELKRGGR